MQIRRTLEKQNYKVHVYKNIRNKIRYIFNMLVQLKLYRRKIRMTMRVLFNMTILEFQTFVKKVKY